MNKFRIFLTVGVIAMSMACGSDGSTDPTPESTPLPTTPIQVIDEDTCQLESKSVIIDALGGECKIVVKTNRTYTLSTTSSWIIINDDARGVSNFEHIITIAENLGEKREGVVKIKFEDTKKTKILDFKVTQTASGVISKDREINGGINDMSQKLWDSKIVTLDHHIDATVRPTIEFRDGETEYNQYALWIQNKLQLNSTYKGDVITDVKTGVVTLSYEGGYLEDSERVMINVLQENRAYKPSDFKYGFAIASDGSVISANTQNPRIAMKIGTNDFQEIIIKIDRSCIQTRKIYSPGMNIKYIDDLGDQYTLEIRLPVEVY